MHDIRDLRRTRERSPQTKIMNAPTCFSVFVLLLLTWSGCSRPPALPETFEDLAARLDELARASQDFNDGETTTVRIESTNSDDNAIVFAFDNKSSDEVRTTRATVYWKKDHGVWRVSSQTSDWSDFGMLFLIVEQQLLDKICRAVDVRYRTPKSDPSKRLEALEAVRRQLGASSPILRNSSVQLTVAAAEQVSSLMGQDANEHLLVSVEVAANCQGFKYHLELGLAVPATDYEIGMSQKIRIGILKKHEAFLEGAVIDWGSRVENGPSGFIFNNDREDVMLLPEYQEMAARKEDEWYQDRERAEAIDPIEALANVKSSKNQSAFDSLRLFNKHFGPQAEDAPPKFDPSMSLVDGLYRRVTHVMECPTGDGRSIIAVFHGGVEGEPKGGCLLYDENGHDVPFYANANYLDDEGTFADLNGDGIIETSQTIPCAVLDADETRAIGSYEKFIVAPIVRESTPLLTIVFDVRRFTEDAQWRCRLTERETEGVGDIVLEKPGDSDFIEVARYRWSNVDKMYIGPNAGEGFIARTGEIPEAEINEFCASGIL